MKANTYNVDCPKCKHKFTLPGKILEQIQENFDKEFELKISEKNQLLSGLAVQVKNMQKKLEQGSQQSQGEAGELLVQDFLTRLFPLDTFKEVPKGVTGGDIIQQINTKQHDNLATILYEIKRTKSFNMQWLSKVSEDARNINALFAIIVTETMQNNNTGMCQINGVWICTVYELKALATILRYTAEMYAVALLNQQHMDVKLDSLYQYITSQEFTTKIQGILGCFLELESELTKEKRAMEAIWKRREGNIDKIVKHSSQLYGSLKAIAGESLIKIEALELINQNDE